MDLSKSIGLKMSSGQCVQSDPPESKLVQYINLKLAYLGCPSVVGDGDSEFDEMATSLLLHHQETDRLLSGYLCPADQRIQDYINALLAGTPVDAPLLPGKTFVLDRHGLARTLSLPPSEDKFVSEIVSSYRVKQGILHNPRSDRRTTEGIFHVTQGGLPIPDDKKSVPVSVFGNVLRKALNPPSSLLQLPFTSAQAEQAECFVSLLLRPLVAPCVPGLCDEKRMEIRFFVPGNLVGNLDFVESIFGNAGDPYLPENDAALDVSHWTGHSGCVILAPHLVRVTKKEVGLPRYDDATERERRDGMCWKSDAELYNDGGAFKLTSRGPDGVIVTIIADNYFGYCKKEVKTQISYAANLGGISEEEHAGGALVFPSHDLGEGWSGDRHAPQVDYKFEDVIQMYGSRLDVKSEGYAIDREYPEIIYVSEHAVFDLIAQNVRWPAESGEQTIKLLPGNVYIRPSGYKVHMEKVPNAHVWRLVGTMAEGTFCHKPCTVSGGGKSEISKPISDAILQGPVFVADFQKDFDQVQALIERNYGDRFIDPAWKNESSRPLLSPDRSLGSVIKLLTPATREYSAEYNAWLITIPYYIKEMLFIVKRLYKPEWGDNWREHFSVDIVNGTPGNELRCDGRKLVASFLRVGYALDGSWRTFGLRQDFHAAAKVAREDDISVSMVVPTNLLTNLNQDYNQSAVKIVQNCEYRLFQRPDDAIVRGYDKLTEADFAQPGNFLSNYEPLSPVNAHEFVDDAIGFDEFTEPMRQFIKEIDESNAPAYFVSSAHPRIVDGARTKNPRYLQIRPDFFKPIDLYIAELGTRMYRRIPAADPVILPVNAILPGRRNNPPDTANAVRPLSVFNPIHYLPTPELFIEYISSMTGKSPSTTGAGSEGALTKGPFNALLPILDVNNALVSHLLTDSHGFLTAAGYVGPHLRVDHDVSLIVPELWSRMTVEERDPNFLIESAYLEKCEDLVVDGRTILTSRLGYRITRRFVRAFFGRIFNHPQAVFTDDMLRPEKQDLGICVDSMENIVSTHRRVASLYFNDGSIDLACPALKVLLHIMRDDNYEGKDLNHPEIRALFTRESLLSSDWYAERLIAEKSEAIALWSRHVRSLELFLGKKSHADEIARLGIPARLDAAKQKLAMLRNSSAA